MYHMSDRALRNLREEIVQARDDFAKKMAGLKRRSKKAARATADDDEMDLQAFAAGLADECPKCGVDFAELRNEGITTEVHLMNCNDEKAHRKQQTKKEATRKKETAKEEAQATQNDAESMAAWGFLGKNNDQLYLLSKDQLQKEMKEKGLESNAGSDKADMIAALVNQDRGLVVRDGRGGKGGEGSASNLPSMETLQRMDVAELRAVLASHGVGGGKLKGMSKRKMLDLLEDKVYKGGEDDDTKEVKLLANGDDYGRNKPAKRRRKEVVVDSEDDNGSDGDWNPDT
jgi:hypothetical protein